MRMKDLRVPRFEKPMSRRMYAFCWAPFDLCWSLLTVYVSFLIPGFGLATLGWVLFMSFFYFIGHLTGTLAIGATFLAIIAGAGLTALLTLFAAFR